MSQHDFEILTADANTGTAMRAAINAALQALASCSSGASEPTTMYAYQLWADTANSLLKMRNAANNAWITLGTLGSALLGLIDDTAYDATSWNGVTDKAPSKNAVRDKFESLGIPSKASSSEVATGTDDDKFVTAKAIKDSVNVPNVAPGNSGNVLTSNGSSWASSAPSGGNSFVAPTLYGTPTAELVIGAAPTERTTTSTSYTKLKQITVKKAGTYIIRFQIKNGNAGGTTNGRIYKNTGVEIGTERTTTTYSTSYETFSEALTLAANDQIQIYIKTSNASYTAYITDFSIQAHDDSLSTIDMD